MKKYGREIPRRENMEASYYSEGKSISIKDIGAWIAVALLMICLIVYKRTMAATFFTLVIALIVPVQEWQEITSRYIKHGWMKILLAVILFFTGVTVIPSNSSTKENQIQHDTFIEEMKEKEDLEEAATASSEPTPVGTATSLPEDTFFEVHYIDVGQGNATLVVCDNTTMLIDGGKPQQSDLIYTYLKDKGIDNLTYIVATHPDEDHVGGLAGALNYATVKNALSPVTEYDTREFESFVKYLEKQGVSITVPTAGDTLQLGSATVTVLGPLEVNSEGESNNNSIVLRVIYGENSFIFMGDAETEEESKILEIYADELQSDVILIGHHGSSSSTSSVLLDAVSPQYAVISVGEDNAYGHPTEETLEKLHQAGVVLYRTDMNGDVICKSDGQNIVFEVEKNEDENAYTYALSTPTPEPIAMPALTPAPAINKQSDTNEYGTGQSGESSSTYESGTQVDPVGTDYVVNTNTGVFHYSGCGSVKRMKDKNKMFYFGTRDDLIARGYSPCDNCHP